MTISVPESLTAFVEQQVARGKYADAEQYLRALVEADRKQKAREHREALIQGIEVMRVLHGARGIEQIIAIASN